MLKQTFLVVLAVSWPFFSNLFRLHAEEVEAKSYPVLSGIGLALKVKEGSLYVGIVMPRSPAAKSGMIADGARLVSVEVDGKETLLDGKTVGEGASLIRGPVGTEIVLAVVPPNEEAAIKVRLIREPLEIDGVSDANYKAFIGKPMPELKLASLDGTTSSQLADYRGKVFYYRREANLQAQASRPFP